MSLNNRTAVIIGAAGELGSVLARDLASQGANLALVGREQTKLDALAASLGLPPDRYLALVTDLLDQHAAQAAVETVQARFGRVDIVLHLIGGWSGGKTLSEMPAADLEGMLNQHIWTTFNVAQSFVPALVRNGWGRMLIISSPTANQAKAKSGAYVIAKAGQEALMLTLAQELLGSGVTANVLVVRTIDIKRKKGSQPSAENAAWTTPEAISAAVLYLLSDEAAAVNGSRIPLYGGYTP